MKPELHEVVQLQSSYSYTHDHGEVGLFVDLFAEDAVFILPDGTAIAGHAELAEWANTSVGAGVHNSGAPLIRHDGSACTPFVFVSRGNVRVSSGYYLDTFARSEAGVLVFHRREVETFPDPNQK